VLLYDPVNAKYGSWFAGFWNGHDWVAEQNPFYRIEPTHWAPLPAVLPGEHETSGDPFALGGRQDDAELFDLIAEEARLCTIGVEYRGQADELWFALGDEERRAFGDVDETDLPAPFGPLYALAVRYENEAGEVLDRINASIPVTAAGAIALLEWAEHMVCPEVRDNVVAYLRTLSAGSAA
jgi:hypothetical protein